MYKIVTKGVDIAAWKCLSHALVNTVRKGYTADGSPNNAKIAEQMASMGPDGSGGWDFQYPAIILSPTTFPFRDMLTNDPLDEKKLFTEAIQARHDLYEALKVDSKTADELAGFRLLFCDKEGRLLIPKFGEHHWMISGNQRLVRVLPNAAGLALKRGIPFKATIPSIIIESDSMTEIQAEQIRGNQFQLALNKMSRFDLLGPAINFVRQGLNEQRFCELVATKAAPSPDDSNDPSDKKVDKNLGRFVYKLAQVVNVCMNMGIPFYDLLSEGVKPTSWAKGKEIPIERFKMTGGGPFDLAQTFRCLVEVTNPVNGLALYCRKFKGDKPEDLSDEERDVYINGPWGKERLQQWVNSVTVGGDAKTPEATPKVKGFTADEAKAKVEVLGSNLLKEYIHDLFKEEKNSDALTAMSNIGRSIDVLKPICDVSGGSAFLRTLADFCEVHKEEAGPLMAKLSELVTSTADGTAKAKSKSKKKEAVTE